VASWQAEPARVSGEWICYRQVSPEWAPLYHAAGEPVPSQSDARWHRQSEGYAQYMALEPLGAWAELVRYEGIRGNARADQYRRKLWVMFVREDDIADLSTFDAYDACGLDPRLAVGKHTESQKLADDLRAAGFRGVLSPSAALVGATNLTLFGARYEKVLLGGLATWPNPQPGLRLPCSLVVEGNPPDQLVTETVFEGIEHDGYRDWLKANRKPLPADPP
jgi:hypothetical protein